MKRFAFLCFLLMLANSCTNEDDTTTPLEILNGPSQEGTFEFSFYKDSQLSIVSNTGTYLKWANIESGEKIVFEYEFTADDEPLIADDEYSETIRFEIDKNAALFSLKNSDLNTTKTTFTKYCFCFFQTTPEKAVAPTGTITGKKLSETEWDISIDVIFYGNEKRTFNGIFKLKSLAD